MLLIKYFTRVNLNNFFQISIGFISAFLFGILINFLPLHIFFIIIGAVAFIILIYYRFEWGIALLIASMLYEKEVIPGLSLTTFIFIPVFAFILLEILLGRKNFYFNKRQDIIIFLLFLWMTISIFYAKNTSAVITNLITYFQLIITYFIIKSSIDNEAEFQKIFKTFTLLGISIIILSSISILKNPADFFFADEISNDTRVQGSALNPNMFARILVFMLPCCIYFSIKRNKLFFIPVIIISILIIGTFSRAGILGMIFVYMLSITILFKYFKKGFIFAIIIVVSLGTIILLFNIENLIINRFLQNDKGGSIETRLDMVDTALDMVAKKPLTGVGLNNFIVNSHLYGRRPHYMRAAHNGYLDIMATLGIPGFLLLLSLVYFSFNNISRAKNISYINQKNFNVKNDILLIQFIKIAFIAYLIMALWGALLPNKIFWVLLAFSEIIYKFSQQSPINGAGSGQNISVKMKDISV